MAAVCAAFVSSRAGRSAGARHLPIRLLSRRTLSSTASRSYATEEGRSDELRDALASSRGQAPQIKRGSLGSSSIFSDEDEFEPPVTSSDRPVPKPKHRRKKHDASSADGDGAASERLPLEERDLTNLDRTLDPRPNARIRWQRRMVINDLRRRGRLSKKEQIMRTERQSLTRSHWFKTSLKKLGPLARQIAGKNIDDAILQMRFSKKKAAKDVKGLLEQARDEAVVARGMGLARAEAMRAQLTRDPVTQQSVQYIESEEGSQQAIPEEVEEDKAQKAEVEGKEGKEEEEEDLDKKLITPSWRTPRHVPGFDPVEVRTKEGTKLRITDPSTIYIAEAWVNRGPYGAAYSHRARGNIQRLRLPYTGLSVVLKEEKTRIREYQDRVDKEAKRRKEKLWVPLPDRKIYHQNQYYSW